MKRIYFGLVLTLFALGAGAQQRQQIAVFTPLYLDSVMDASGNFRFARNTFPRYVLPGLEFFEGVKAAIDSLEKRGAPLEFFIYDSRGRQTLAQQTARPEWRSMDLIIGQTNAAETRVLAETAQRLKIPFISATYPNDAGIGNNPYFVVLNTTLEGHVEGIYRFLQKHHAADRIVVFGKPGTQEDQLKSFFTDATRNTAATPLNIKYVSLPAAFTAQQLSAHLDSNRRNICIAGSLDEAFANRLLGEMAKINSTYPSRVIGMPTWDRINLSKFSGVEVVYTSPFHHNRSTDLEVRLGDAYAAERATRATDLFYRGYESTLRFAFLLLDAKTDIASNLTRKGNTVFTQFDIQPVFRDKASMTLDYFENKHLYFIKAFGGVKNIIY